MPKATHKGTCQICGSVQKLPGGRLSQHGYTVDWGFFNGVCGGAHGLPFEQSCDLIESAIESADAQAAKLRAEIAELETTTEYAEVAIYYGYRDHPNGKGGEIIEKHNRDELSIESRDLEDGATLYFVEVIEQRTGKKQRGTSFTGRSIAAAMRRANDGAIRRRVRAIAQIEKYVAWQRERIAGWKPAELLPI